ncbi:MAG TPA: hypothetical protein VF214_02120 [Edaphobacter sp.]
MSVTAQPKHILLMTATVTPKNATNLVRTDPIARLNDYQWALDFYLNFIDAPLHGIVFVENSDSDVTSLRELVEARNLTERVEFLCNYGLNSYSEYGRGYGELKLLDYAMTQSTTIRNSLREAIIWKITGRYVVKNLQSVIARAPKRFDAYIDMKNRPMPWMDMRLMAWTASGYDRIFRGIADDLGATTHETYLREYLPKRANGALLTQRFRNEPRIDGIRGYDNRNYSEGANLLKFYVRSLGRVVAPWYWI